jgi:hypothetical protein
MAATAACKLQLETHDIHNLGFQLERGAVVTLCQRICQFLLSIAATWLQ